jgi:hypothetical protein
VNPEAMVSPILVRPVREQLEHDRIIRLLQARSRRRYEVGINPGAEQNAAVGAGTRAAYPDVVYYSTDRARKLQGIVEVETGESVNHLEALAQWAHYSRLKVPFHLYVPAATIDVARRLSSDHQIPVAELWIYDNIGDQVRFTLVQRSTPAPVRAAAAPRATAARPAAPARPSASRKARSVARPVKAAGKRAVASRTRKTTARKGGGKAASQKAAPQKSASQKTNSPKRR